METTSVEQMPQTETPPPMDDADVLQAATQDEIEEVMRNVFGENYKDVLLKNKKLEEENTKLRKDLDAQKRATYEAESSKDNWQIGAFFIGIVSLLVGASISYDATVTSYDNVIGALADENDALRREVSQSPRVLLVREPVEGAVSAA